MIAKCVFNGCGWERALRYPMVSDVDVALHSLAHLKGYPSHLVQMFTFDPAEADEITSASPLPEDVAALSVCAEPGCDDPVCAVIILADLVTEVRVCRAHAEASGRHVALRPLPGFFPAEDYAALGLCDWEGCDELVTSFCGYGNGFTRDVCDSHAKELWSLSHA